MRRRRSGVRTHDARALGPVVLRTWAARLAAGAVAVAALAAAVSASRGLETHRSSIVPGGTSVVVVVDLSLSIAERHYDEVRRALTNVVAADAPVGLVVFSDVAYELLPPGTPARELRPVVRVLVPAGRGRHTTPWVQSFRAGTKISDALGLAARMLRRDDVANGSILLLSDLQTAPDDIAALTRTVEELRRRSVEVRVVPMGALTDGRLLFGRLLGPDAIVEPETIRGEGEPVSREQRLAALPRPLLALALLLFVALAAYERVSARLALPRPAGRPA